jgi:hypothetical protein
MSALFKDVSCGEHGVGVFSANLEIRPIILEDEACMEGQMQAGNQSRFHPFFGCAICPSFL